MSRRVNETAARRGRSRYCRYRAREALPKTPPTREGLLLAGAGGRAIRAVTHMNVDRGQCEAAAGIVRDALRG
jgi:hypothetical protein